MKLVVNEDVRKTVEEHFPIFKNEYSEMLNLGEEYETYTVIEYVEKNKARGEESEACNQCPYINKCDRALVILEGKIDLVWCKNIFDEVK